MTKRSMLSVNEKNLEIRIVFNSQGNVENPFLKVLKKEFDRFMKGII